MYRMECYFPAAFRGGSGSPFSNFVASRMDHFGNLLGDFLGDCVQHVKYQIQPLFTMFGAYWGRQEMHFLNYVLFIFWQLLFDAGFCMHFHKFEPLWASKTCLVDGADSRGEWPGGSL